MALGWVTLDSALCEASRLHTEREVHSRGVLPGKAVGALETAGVSGLWLTVETRLGRTGQFFMPAPAFRHLKGIKRRLQ